MLKTIPLKFNGKCYTCKAAIPAGDLANWDKLTKRVYHLACSPADAPGVAPSELPPTFAAPKVKLKVKAKKLATVPGSILEIPNPQTATGQNPISQKAKGILALQSSGMLSTAMARVCLTLEEALTAADYIGLPCFVRPCPEFARHGFVDSRVVQTLEEVSGVWSEARAVDPKAELIVMPYVDATYNMVWRPGLLSIGPGHDGATAGHDSVSVFLQGEYSGTWENLSKKAGVKIQTQDPFLESVANQEHELVVTQIRAGVKGTPTAPDWNPEALEGMTVGEVVTIDPSFKAIDGAMLAWETQAKELKPGYHVVYNPGGNLGDHWSVHAQLAGVTVITSFVPQIGQTIPKLGIDLVELEPQAVIFGFLGGLLGPSLKHDHAMRRRAVCAAIMGTHHGLRMGGDAGVFLGASVAFMLRLGQAALWGEARHAEKSTGGGKLSRDQIYQNILDDWAVGREKLADKVGLFFTHSWGGGFGGKPWAACGQGTIDLDASMLALIKSPSRTNVKNVMASLTNVVNLAHNNGWWMNKFITHDWFDKAADLDPRVALMAGPAWYESAIVPCDARMTLLGKIENMTPIDLMAVAGPGAGAKVKGKPLVPKSKAAVGGDELPSPSMHNLNPGPQIHKTNVANVNLGEGTTFPHAVTGAQCVIKSTYLHVQVSGSVPLWYGAVDVMVTPEQKSAIRTALQSAPVLTSKAGSSTPYLVLGVVGSGSDVGGIGIFAGPHLVCSIASLKGKG